MSEELAKYCHEFFGDSVEVSLQKENHPTLPPTDWSELSFEPPVRERFVKRSSASKIKVIQSMLAKGVEAAQIRMSHAHTQGLEFTAGVSALHVASMGIDFESKSRQISDRTQARILHSSEQNLGLSALEVWVIKEACFKAIPNNDAAVLSGVRILPDQRALFSREASHESDEIELIYRYFEIENFCFALAKLASHSSNCV